jgi:cobalt-zinc-cadmium resistance protein CzcA
MIARVLALSVKFRWGVLFLAALVAAFGAYNLVRLRIDATPDVTNKQVQINTLAPALNPSDVERRVTFPVETALAGIPGLESTRSQSRNGFSQVVAVFADDIDIYFARQQIYERLAQARESLPSGVDPRPSPITSGLGEIYMWSVDFAPRATVRDGAPGWQLDGAYLTPEGERLADTVAQLGYLRTVQDWIIRPQLRAVAGIAGIDSIGGYDKQYVVEPDPSKLAAYGISFADLAQGLERANVAVGANYLNRGGEAYLVRADARIRDASEIERAVVGTRGGVPIAVRDVARVAIGGDLRTGAAGVNGHEAVVGTALMLTGENSRVVAKRVGERLAQVERSLPPGVVVRPLYDRSRLVDATIATVATNLAEGALFVVAVLFLLLGNLRAALITTLVIPLSMLMTGVGMNRLGISGNLMSLGALDFGLIVDGAVIIVENCLRQLAERQHRQGRILNRAERLDEVRDAAAEMVRPSVYGQAIILIVYAPLLTFSGVEGKMFTPMAVTVMLALAAAFVLSLTFVPATVAILISGRVAEKDVRVVAWAKRRYVPALRWTLGRPLLAIGGGLAMVAIAAVAFAGLGREFIPQLDEQDILIESNRVPSTSLAQSVAMETRIERAVASFPEVAVAFSKTGTAEIANDPDPPSSSLTFVILNPRSTWPTGLTKVVLAERIEAKLNELVGNTHEFSQPIQLRTNELIAGARSDVAVSIYGDDLAALGRAANAVADQLRKTPGGADVRIEQTGGFPTIDVIFDRDAIARYGLSVSDVADTLAAGMEGRNAGLVFQGDRRFDVVVRLPEAVRGDLGALGALPVILPDVSGGGPRASVPLRAVARFSATEGLNQISRSDGKRRVIVQANVRGRDLGGFVTEARARVQRDVRLPIGAYVAWGGQFKNLQAAQARLGLVVPLCIVLILALLYAALGGVRPALVVFSAVPMALAGGAIALALRGLPFSISAAVGFIALSGVAVLNGLVLMSSIGKRIAAGELLDLAIIGGAVERLRPVLMTALVASLGFVPMALATGTGAEVQRPLATVVIGGLITATALTLFVLPALVRLLGVRSSVAVPS